MKARYVCHVLLLNEAVACWCFNIDTYISNAFDARVSIAKADNFVLYWLVVSETRLVVADVCICAVIKTEVAIMLITLCGA